MPKVTQRRALDTLSKARLDELARLFDLDIDPKEKKSTFVESLASSRKASFERILGRLTTQELQIILDVHSIQYGDVNAEGLKNLVLGYEDEESSSFLVEKDVDEEEETEEEAENSYTKGSHLERAFKKYMETKREYGFVKVRHDVQCKGEHADRPYQCDLLGTRGSTTWSRIRVLGIIVTLASVALLGVTLFVPEMLVDVKSTTDDVVGQVDPSLVPYSLSIVFILIGCLGFIIGTIGKSKKREFVWVECKNKSGKVKRKEIEVTAGAVKDVCDASNTSWKPSETWFVSSSGFDQDALSIARKYDIRCFKMDLATNKVVEDEDRDSY